MCRVAHWLWHRGLTGSLEGNLSCRLTDQTFLCTPSMLHKGMLNPDDLVVVDAHGNAIGPGKPTSELKLHLQMYRLRPDAKAIVHAHPQWATAMALNHETIPDDYLPEAACLLGSVCLLPFVMPGTILDDEQLRPIAQEHKSFLMANHGALVLANDLVEGFSRMETLERIAAVVSVARLTGQPRSLPPAAMATLLKIGLSGSLD